MRKSINMECSTGDPWLDLIGAVFRVAIRDAKAGDRGARWWLWQVWPELAQRWQIDNELNFNEGGD